LVNAISLTLHPSKKKLSVKDLKLKKLFFLVTGACAGGSSEGGVSELGLPNVAGVFIVTVIGCLVAL
jgi:hypothetical protein